MTRQNGGDFDDLLAWLDPDREAAARQYEEIRHNLIQLFTRNGCHDPEGMAEENIARVTERVVRLSETYEGAPALFFYGVAKKQLLEYHRRRTVALTPGDEPVFLPPQPEDLEREERDERLHDCFDECLGKLSPGDRDLALGYYKGRGQDKIANRKRLADEKRIGLNALRVRVLRIRAGLRACVEDCLARPR
ncbi:MAG TPA: hypothetical protein VF668_17210 [Pyrinomonadaceae bacterium]|jgi:DNA-directed RNA polymerase specialized sigma24 family protein